MIVAVDGPAGAGKSTVAKILAKKLGFVYIDTGAMYRALTLKAIEEKLNLNDRAALAKMAKNSAIDLVNDPDGSLKVILDCRDVSLLIREPRITRIVSDIAKIREIREVMVELQRNLGRQKDCVVDGRDIGTVVFPDAERKFYINADFKERVKRRYQDLQNLQVTGVSMEDVARDLKNRDNIDTTREVAPLKQAEDAIYLDTTDMSIEEVVEKMLNSIR